MLRWYVYLMNLRKDEEGQDLVEYALLLGLITLAAVAAIGLTGDAVEAVWLRIQNVIGGALNGA